MSGVQHALLGASSAAKWLNCTPSARLEETFPDEESTYAAEGHLAHEIAELKLRQKHIEPMTAKAYKAKLDKLKKNPLYQQEMDACTDTYIEYIADLLMTCGSNPHIAAEKRVDYSRYAPEGFGTADCIIIGGGTLHIVDYKHGKGVPVSAENNPQMKLYALGALAAYGLLYDVSIVTMSIVQPRLDNISEYTVWKESLFQWAEEIVQPAAKLAHAGEGAFCPGPWCSDHFCKARHTCRARAAANLDIDPRDAGIGPLPLPPLLTNAEVGATLLKAQELAKWAKELEEYALSAILEGKQIAGWKCVEGRRTRSFDDIDATFNAVKAAGYDEALLYERKPITLTAVEKLLGKTKFTEILSSHVIVPPGKPTLAPAADKREAYRPNGAAADFKGVEGAE